MYYNIIVARPFDQVFTYESNNQTLKVGQIVIVPFGKAMEVGMVMEADVKKPDYTIKKIETCLLYTSPSPRDRTRSRMPSSA